MLLNLKVKRPIFYKILTNQIFAGLDIKAIVRHTGGSPNSPQSADSNSNVPSSSHSSLLTNEVQSSRHLIFENAIKPSISLIPIKQVSFELIPLELKYH